MLPARQPNLFPYLARMFQQGTHNSQAFTKRSMSDTKPITPCVIFAHVHPAKSNGLYNVITNSVRIVEKAEKDGLSVSKLEKFLANLSDKYQAKLDKSRADLGRARSIVDAYKDKSDEDLASDIFNIMKLHIDNTVEETAGLIKAAGHDKIMVLLSSPEGYFQTPEPLGEKAFLDKVLNPLIEYSKEQPAWLHFNLGTMAVIPTMDNMPYIRIPQKVLSIVQDISTGSSYQHIEDYSKPEGTSKMMHLAVLGACGKDGYVSYYTKKLLFRNDLHIGEYEQVFAKDKPSIVTFQLGDKHIARQSIICADNVEQVQLSALEIFLKVNCSRQFLPSHGITDVIGAGVSPDLEASLYHTISVNDIGSPSVYKVSAVSPYKVLSKLESIPHDDKPFSYQVAPYWSVSGIMRIFDGVSLGEKSEFAKKNENLETSTPLTSDIEPQKDEPHEKRVTLTPLSDTSRLRKEGSFNKRVTSTSLPDSELPENPEDGFRMKP